MGTSPSMNQVKQVFVDLVSLLMQIGLGNLGSSLKSRTRIKTLAYDTILANARFFNNDIDAVCNSNPSGESWVFANSAQQRFRGWL